MADPRVHDEDLAEKLKAVNSLLELHYGRDESKVSEYISSKGGQKITVEPRSCMDFPEPLNVSEAVEGLMVLRDVRVQGGGMKQVEKKRSFLPTMESSDQYAASVDREEKETETTTLRKKISKHDVKGSKMVIEHIPLLSPHSRSNKRIVNQKGRKRSSAELILKYTLLKHKDQLKKDMLNKRALLEKALQLELRKEKLETLALRTKAERAKQSEITACSYTLQSNANTAEIFGLAPTLRKHQRTPSTMPGMIKNIGSVADAGNKNEDNVCCCYRTPFKPTRRGNLKLN